jgi:hypothetical protein
MMISRKISSSEDIRYHEIAHPWTTHAQTQTCCEHAAVREIKQKIAENGRQKNETPRAKHTTTAPSQRRVAQRQTTTALDNSPPRSGITENNTAGHAPNPSGILRFRVNYVSENTSAHNAHQPPTKATSSSPSPPACRASRRLLRHRRRWMQRCWLASWPPPSRRLLLGLARPCILPTTLSLRAARYVGLHAPVWPGCGSPRSLAQRPTEGGAPDHRVPPLEGGRERSWCCRAPRHCSHCGWRRAGFASLRWLAAHLQG